MSKARSRKKKRLPDSSLFETEATAVLAQLQARLVDVLRSLGNVSKSGDLERLLNLDRTLAWQLIKVAEADVPLESAASVPSRVSMNRLVQGARAQGVSDTQADSLISAYDAFESLVERHAGDRVCFNSMVTAAVGGDGWHAAELQHRRNVFRGMSHMTGVQAGALMRCGIVRKMPDDPKRVELVLIGGLVDLRLLWEIERVNVFRSRTFGTGQGPGYRKEIVRSPISGEAGLGGYLLDKYCSQPTPTVEMVSGEAGWIYGNLLDGRVGATGESTMFFGVRYRHIPNPAGREGEYGARSLIDLPVKVYIADMLIEHELAPDWNPQVQVLIGSSSSDQPSPPGIERSLPSQMNFEFLGTGPSIVKELRTYPEMVRSVAGKAGFDVSGFDCWRLRVEYPLYGSEIVSELVEPERAR